MKKRKSSNIIIKLFFCLFSLCFIVPIIAVIGISLTEEKILISEGYKIWPQKMTWNAYLYIFKNPKGILNAYKTTIIYSFFGTFLSVLVMSLMAYPLSRRNYTYRKPITFMVFFTMLFSGGLIPSYILNTSYLHLGNTIWIYILPSLASAWHIILIRTFFQGIPSELAESAKIDGCTELRTFFQIMLPLSKPVIATVSFLILLAKWNDWNTSLIYIKDSRLHSLQYLLQKIMDEAEYLKKTMELAPVITLDNDSIPSESIKFAMCVVASGPMLMVFPFFQKYFSKGLTVGAVKG